MKLRGSNKNEKIKIIKVKNGENVLHLEIAEGLLVHYNIVDSEFSSVEVWSPDENSKLREIEDKISIALVIN